MTNVEIFPVITAATAVSALILSLFNTIEGHRSKHRALDVSLSFGILGGYRTTTTGLILRAGNRGLTEVTVVGCGLRLPGPMTAVFTSTREIPKRVAVGDGITEFQELEPFLAELRGNGLSGRVPVYAFVNDATGREHVARKPLMLDVTPSAN